MNDFNLFNFNNISYTKFPASLKARYLFESEVINLPETEIQAEIPAKTWMAFDDDNNLYTFSFDQFLDIYIASDKKTQRYLEFVLDSKNNEYQPSVEKEFTFNLFEEIFGDLIEKEVPIKKRWRLIFDLFSNKKIYLSKYL